MTDGACSDHPPTASRPPIPPCIPAEWETEVLEDHVAQIVFDPYSSYRPDCALCRRAAAAGLFAIFGALSPAGRGTVPAEVDDNGAAAAANSARPGLGGAPIAEGVAIASSQGHDGGQPR